MMNKICWTFILSAIFFSAVVISFADQSNPSPDGKSSADSTSGATVQVPALPVGASAADAQPSYLYDLKKLIEKSRDNIKQVNQKIKEQAVLKRNQKREERAREYYEKGLALTSEGKLQEAREYFEKAIRITEHPEMAGYIKESQRRLRKQEEALSSQEKQRNNQIKQDQVVRKEDVESSYREAVDLYKQKKFHPAKDAFEHVDEISPDYRATSSYLKIIDQDIVLADAMAVKQQAVEIQHQQQEAEVARAKEKAVWMAQIEEKEKERKEAINKQAADVYDQAVELYKDKKFAEAKKKFEEVSWVIPDYKATMKYLRRIDRDAELEEERIAKEQQKALEEQRWEEAVAEKKKEAERQHELEVKAHQHVLDLQEQAQFLYRAAVSFFDQKNYDDALQRFNDIEKLYPDFKSTRAYIARIQQIQQDQQKQVEVLQKQQYESQFDGTYLSAVNHYKSRDYEIAKDEFLKVQAKVPGYKSTQSYLNKIDRSIKEEQEEKLRQQELAVERKRMQELKDKENKAQNIYDQALSLYRNHQWQESKTQFDNVEQVIPDFKRTHRYLQKIEDNMAEEARRKAAAVLIAKPTPVVVIPPAPVVVPPPVAVVVPTPPVVQAVPQPPVVSVIPAPVQVAISLEDQQKQAQDIAALAQKSAELYHQIADVADDKTTVQAKKKMAKVDEILRGLKENKERLLRQMRKEEWRRQRDEANAKEAQHKAEIEKLYHDAQELLRSHEYAKAKIKFLVLENVQPDYRGTRHYLNSIEADLKNANVEAVTSYEKNQAVRLNQLQSKENAEEVLRVRQEEEKQRLLDQQQQVQLQSLAQKASDINDDIIRLSHQQDYEGMKAKFAELENTVTELTTLKDEMAKQKDHQEREKQLVHESILHHKEMIKAERQEDRQIHAYYREQPLNEYRPELSIQTTDADQYKTREVVQEQNALFAEGVDRYEHKKYTQAKLLFGELAAQHDRRAEVWLKKVDRAITRELLTSQEGEERERTAFLADQLKAQRELTIIQERERLRQKKLTEELESQMRLYDDNRLLQLRKEEMMKSEERERQRQELKRLRLEEQNEKQQDAMRFHKIKIVVKPVPVQAPVKVIANLLAPPTPIITPVPTPAPPTPVTVVAVQAPKAIVPPPLTVKQIQAKIDFSNKRKAFLDNKFKKEQEEKVRQAKIKADLEARQKLKAEREAERQAWIKQRAEARQKRIEERQKTREHQKELRAQRDAERQARLKAIAEAREKIKEEKQKEEEHQQELAAEKVKEEAAKFAQEQKNKEEELRRQEDQRQEKMKQDEIVREEAQRRADLEKQEHERQAQIEAQRQAVRKQLEDGVEEMYQDALSLYQQGDYKSAADRFKDVQDILPGYKRTEQYMDEARQKSLIIKPQDSSNASIPS